jgi:hypothetical protein
MKFDSSFNNFARGQVDHDMMGRYDLPIYQSAADLVQNFITNFKGNAIYRAGFEQILQFQNCVMVEFKFNNTQQYICLFYNTTVKFLAYDGSGNVGLVQHSGSDLAVTTPFTLAECADFQFTQNGDFMVITHSSHEPQQLKRTAADMFTMVSFSRNNDPFPLTWAATKAITGITKDATGAVFTIVGHGYAVGDRFLVAGVTGMTQMNGWTACVSTVVDANNVKVADIDSSGYTAYTANGTGAKVLTGDYPHACCFYKGRLYYAATPAHPTRVFASASGSYNDFTQPGTITDSTAIIFTIAEIAQRIEWLFKGDLSLIAGATDGIIALNGGAVNTSITASTVTATLTTALPCNKVYPFKKDGQVFYMGVDGRNMYTFRYDILQSLFVAEDANQLAYDITLGGVSKMRWKKDRNDLIFFTTANANGNILACNHNLKENIIGWSGHTTQGTFKDIAVILDDSSKPQLFCLALRPDGNYYIERQNQYVEFARRVNFYTGDERADNVAYIRYVANQLLDCNYTDNAVMFNNLQTSNTLTFNGTDTIAAANAIFAVGDVGKHIVYQTQTGYESGRFQITHYTDNKHVTVSVLQTPTTNSWTHPWFLSFSSLSGLPFANGTVVSVVADGGYLNDFTVQAGAIALGGQVTNAWVGLSYKGIIKSFSLGFQIQGLTTEQTMKAIQQFGVRCVTTAGLEVGSSLYNLQPVQERSQSDVNYLPPIPIDGTKYVQFTDDNARDKYFYAVQDIPLPATIACAIVTANYTVHT